MTSWRQGPSPWGPCRAVFLKKAFYHENDIVLGAWAWSTTFLEEAAGAFRVPGPIVLNHKTTRWQWVPRDLTPWALGFSSSQFLNSGNLVVLFPIPLKGSAPFLWFPWQKEVSQAFVMQTLCPWGRPPCAEPWPSSLASPLASMRMSEAGSDPALLGNDCSQPGMEIMHKIAKTMCGNCLLVFVLFLIVVKHVT